MSNLSTILAQMRQEEEQLIKQASQIRKKDREQRVLGAGQRTGRQLVAYVNNISLLADTGGNVYLLGLYRKGSANYADLFAVNVDAVGLPKRVLTKLARVKVQCDDGTGFRWGASALVVSRTKLRLFACEGRVSKNPRRIRLNIFHAKNDPL